MGQQLVTRRQLEVAERKSAGMTNAEIAADLKISRKAVKKRTTRMRARALRRYGKALAKPGGPPVKFRAFSLLPSDNA